MAILDIRGKSVVNATRLRGHKGESQPKGRPMLRDSTTLGHSRRECHGGFLDYWLLPLERANIPRVWPHYEYEETERATGITAREMRRVLEVMHRMEVEADEICPAEAKAKVGKRIREGARKLFDADEVERVFAAYRRGLSMTMIAEELGLTPNRVKSIRKAAMTNGTWPSCSEREALPDKARRVTREEIAVVRKLHAVAGFTQEQVAAKLNLPINRVKAICRFARRHGAWAAPAKGPVAS